MNDTPRVWIGCLASYNAGRLIGEWVDATDLSELEDCRDRVSALAVEAAKKAGEYPVYFGEPEEFFLADHEGFPSGTIGEYSAWEYVAELGAAIEEHGDPFCAYIQHANPMSEGDDVSDVASQFEACYRGEQSLRDYAPEVVSEIGWADVPALLYTERYGDQTINVFDELSSYLDWDTIARDLEQAYTEVTVGSTTYLFEDNA